MPALEPNPAHAIEDQTTTIHTRPHGDEQPREAASPTLRRGRYLLRAGQAFSLTDDVTHLGRGMTADIRLDDHTVSARHAIIVARGERLRILDDRSTNGTVVNGRRVEEAELRDGDVVVLGRVVLTYRVIG